jgi:Flp pilus assembly pilin Flp
MLKRRYLPVHHISLAIIAAVNGIGAKLNTKFSLINASLE